MFINTIGKKQWLRLSFYILFFFGIALSFASPGISKLQHVSFEMAQKLAKNIPSAESPLPVDLNDGVLTQLNNYLGMPGGCAHMQDAMDRMEEHRDIIEKKLAEYGAPKVLLAIPLVESGYRNLPQAKNGKGAGVWQFIQTTANHYGLRVDGQVDERLDVMSETDAAIRYLMANYLRFRDWGLALLAYNTGASQVQKGIDATGSRDPWVLIREGYENDKDYLSKVVATLIIMHNPSVLE